MKPTKTIVPVERALREWRNPEFCYQEKMDGVFAEQLVGNVLLAGERMQDGRFIAFDALARNGEDLRGEPLSVRWPITLSCLVPVVPNSRDGADLLKRVLDAGGEGVVAKRWADGYGPMLAAKRSANYTVRVVGFCGGTQSVTIEDAATGHPRGKVALLGGRVDRVRVGSVLKIEAFGEHASGLLREPRPDKDTPESWLVKF